MGSDSFANIALVHTDSDWGLRVKCHSVGSVVQVFLLLASLSSQAAILANVLSIVLASKTSVQPKKSIVGNTMRQFAHRKRGKPPNWARLSTVIVSQS